MGFHNRSKLQGIVQNGAYIYIHVWVRITRKTQGITLPHLSMIKEWESYASHSGTALHRRLHGPPGTNRWVTLGIQLIVLNSPLVPWSRHCHLMKHEMSLE